VIRSDLARTIPLTTGTFNLVVKDRFASPPERRVFSPGEPALERIRLSPKPFKVTVPLLEVST